MKTELKEIYRKYKLAILTAIICSVLLISAYAVSYLWSATATVGINTSSPYIKVYLDLQCTDEVTSINFGNLVPGSQVSVYLYIKNTHPNASFSGINWGSTLNNVTNKIAGIWGVEGGWPTNLDPGEARWGGYTITVASDCPLGTYSWTLYLYGPG